MERMMLKLDDFTDRGLYLVMTDSRILNFSDRRIAEVTDCFWNDPARIPPKMRDAAEFHQCPVCPERDFSGMCYSLRPVLPFIEQLDDYVSYSEVTAVFREPEKEIWHVADSTMQHALQYVSILSILFYCRAGMKFTKYLSGIIPIMDTDSVLKQLYLNIYWFHKGNLNEIKQVIADFKETVEVTSTNAMKRLDLICRNDAFLNAFYNMSVAAEILSMDMEGALRESFQADDSRD